MRHIGFLLGLGLGAAVGAWLLYRQGKHYQHAISVAREAAPQLPKEPRAWTEEDESMHQTILEAAKHIQNEDHRERVILIANLRKMDHINGTDFAAMVEYELYEELYG